MDRKNKQKKELTLDRTTWEQFHKLKLKTAIMKKHLEYQALYGESFNPPVIKSY